MYLPNHKKWNMFTIVGPISKASPSQLSWKRLSQPLMGSIWDVFHPFLLDKEYNMEYSCSGVLYKEV